MSTRGSIHYSTNIHIYKEMLFGEICIEVDLELSKTNDIYGDPVITLDQLRQMKNDIEAFLKHYPEDKK